MYSKIGAKRAELVQKFVKRSRIGNFRNERTRSTPCDPKLIFWCVRAIWVHSGLFGCLTKLGAKWAELVQNFVLRIRFEIFRKERNRSTLLDPKLTFWCVSYYLVVFGTVWPNEFKISCNEVASEFFVTNTPDTPHWTLKLRFGAFHNIWVHSGPFGCLTKLGAKRADLVQKFVPRSHVVIFCNERTRSKIGRASCRERV